MVIPIEQVAAGQFVRVGKLWVRSEGTPCPVRLKRTRRTGTFHVDGFGRRFDHHDEVSVDYVRLSHRGLGATDVLRHKHYAPGTLVTVKPVE